MFLKMNTRKVSIVYTLLAALFVIVILSSTSSAWWNESWDYKNVINITNTNSSTFTNAIVEINITKPNNMSSNCSDVRFLNIYDNVTYDHLTYSCTSNSINAFINISSLPGSATTQINMYYGNPNVLSTSSENGIVKNGTYYSGWSYVATQPFERGSKFQALTNVKIIKAVRSTPSMNANTCYVYDNDFNLVLSGLTFGTDECPIDKYKVPTYYNATITVDSGGSNFDFYVSMISGSPVTVGDVKWTHGIGVPYSQDATYLYDNAGVTTISYIEPEPSYALNNQQLNPGKSNIMQFVNDTPQNGTTYYNLTIPFNISIGFNFKNITVNIWNSSQIVNTTKISVNNNYSIRTLLSVRGSGTYYFNASGSAPTNVSGMTLNLTHSAHGITLPSSSASLGQVGLKIHVGGEPVILKAVYKDSGADPTTAFLLSSGQAQLASANYTGDVANFSYQLTANTDYYLTTETPSTTWTSIQRIGATYPSNTQFINWTAGFNTGSEDSNAYTITGIDIAHNITADVTGEFLNWTENRVVQIDVNPSYNIAFVNDTPENNSVLNDKTIPFNLTIGNGFENLTINIWNSSQLVNVTEIILNGNLTVRALLSVPANGTYYFNASGKTSTSSTITETNLTHSAHGITLPSSSASLGQVGLKIHVGGQSVTLKAIYKNSGADPTTAFLLSSGQAQLASATYTGDIANFSYQLSANTDYYLTTETPSTVWTSIQKVGATYPSNTEFINWTAGFNTGSEDSNAYTITGIDIAYNVTYNSIVEFLNWTENRVVYVGNDTVPPAIVLFNGTGIAGDPYQVTNWLQLDYMRLNLSAYYRLENNISSSSLNYTGIGDNFIPIGNHTSGFYFIGNFDGNGYTISDLIIDRPTADFVGLFGEIRSGSNISNLAMINYNITGRSYVGGIVGAVQANSHIINSYSIGNITSSYVGVNGYVGGLVGYLRGKSINSHSSGYVRATAGTDYVGGLVGYLIPNGEVKDSYSNVNIDGSSGSQYVGGLVGYEDTNANVTNSYSSGVVSGNNYVGGLVGYSVSNIINSNSYSNVTGDVVGALVGYLDTTGVVTNSNSILETSSIVSGTTSSGFIINTAGGSIVNSYMTVRNSDGNITFLQNIDGTSGGVLIQNITIGNNLARIESNSQPALNKSADIYLSGLPTGMTNPKILKNGIVCTDCYNYTSLNAGTVKFNVTSWTDYNITDVPLVFPNINIVSPVNGQNFTTKTIPFTINVSLAHNLSLYVWNSSGLINSTTTNGLPNITYIGSHGSVLNDVTYWTEQKVNFTENGSINSFSFITDGVNNPVYEVTVNRSNGDLIQKSNVTFTGSTGTCISSNTRTFTFNTPYSYTAGETLTVHMQLVSQGTGTGSICNLNTPIWAENCTSDVASGFNCGQVSGQTRLGLLFNITSIYSLPLNGNVYTTLSVPADGLYYFNATARNSDGVNWTENRNFLVATTPPNITLIAPPANATFTTSGSVTFQSNVTSNIVNETITKALVNATLFIYNSTGIVNWTTVNITSETQSGGLFTSLVSIVVDIWDGVYEWFFRATDIFNNIGFSGNRTFSTDSIVPSYTVNSPTTNYTTMSLNNTVVLNVTWSDVHLSTCWYRTSDNLTVTTYTCNTSIENNFTQGHKYYYAYANDTFGNENNVTIPFYIYYVQAGSVSTPTITEGGTSNHLLFVNMTNISQWSISAYLVWNGTNMGAAAAVYSSDNNSVTFNKTFLVPNIPGDLNSVVSHTWYYTLSVSPSLNGQVTSQQNYYQYQFGPCSPTIIYKVLNITFVDETTLLPLNATMDASTWTYSFNGPTKTFIFSNLTAHNRNYEFCIYPDYASPITSTETLQYSDSIDGTYPQRRISFVNDSYTNSTVTNKVLYLLNLNNGITSNYQVVNIGNQVIAGAHVTVTRIISGNSVTISDGYTDSSGSIAFFLNPNYDHVVTTTYPGYQDSVVTVRPSQSTYTITLGGGTSPFYYNSTAEGLSYYIFPPNGLINDGMYNFTFKVSSIYTNINGCSFYIRYLNGTIYDYLTGCNNVTPNNGGQISKMINTTGIDKLYGEFLVVIGNQTYRVEGDARWINVPIRDKSGLGIAEAINDFFNLPEWGDNPQTTDFNRLVFFFLALAIVLAMLNFFTGYDTAYPGAFIYIMTLVVVIMSASNGLAGPGFFYLEGATAPNGFFAGFSSFINNWLVAVHFIMLAVIYFFTTNKRYSTG